MYVPSHFEETRTAVLQQLMHDHAHAMLIVLDASGLNANHIPFEFDPDPTPFGTLRAHVARSNPVWKDFARDVEALVVFQGPQAYITPSWYETKKETSKVVPTYNYMVVHAYGVLRVVENKAWLRALVERLTNRFEGARPEPWKVDDAPDDYVDKMLGAIIGLELAITKLAGKWKVSQNRPEADRAGVATGLSASGEADAVAMARVMVQGAES